MIKIAHYIHSMAEKTPNLKDMNTLYNEASKDGIS